MRSRLIVSGLIVIALSVLLAQAPKRNVHSQAASTLAVETKNGQQMIRLANVVYEATGSGIPGRPAGDRLILRKSVRTSEVVDEIGMEAATTVEAWPLGVDLAQKPLYRVAVEGVDPEVVANELLVVARGLEDTEWWSVYRLGNGAHLFDTYTPLQRVSISREIQTLRYVGLEVPPDDSKDARLQAANVVGVLIFASGERVIREALITCDDAKRARLLRSYADSDHALSMTTQSIAISISQGFPSPAAATALSVPIAGGDLDLPKARLPAGIHIAAWKR